MAVNRLQLGEYHLVASSGFRRIALKRPYPVRIQTALLGGTGTIVNLSKGGAFISTEMSILLRSRVQLCVPMLARQGYPGLEAVAVWENSGLDLFRSLPHGYGFRFVHPSYEDRRWIVRLMALVRNGDDSAPESR